MSFLTALIQLSSFEGMDTADRVARRVIAEKLTKQWLMGVRRGWLSLMQPRINSWKDVHKALQRLYQFVQNLRDQIKYIRPGPSRLLDDKFEGKVLNALKKLEEGIQNAEQSAKHWQQVAESPEPLYMGTFKWEDGEHMFTRFRDHFEETTSASVRRRGGGGLSRDASLTELLDKALKLMREDARNLEDYNRGAAPGGEWDPESAFTEFDLQGMKIVVDDSTLRPGMINGYVKWFLQAKKLLENRGFGKLWYGTLFIRCKECGGENPHGKEFGVGGDYAPRPNTIRIYNRPGTFILSLLIHELGHRWWYKFMSSGQRAKFTDLTKVKRDMSKADLRWIDDSVSQMERWGSDVKFDQFDISDGRVDAWAKNFQEKSREVLSETAKMLGNPDPSDPEYRKVIEVAKDVADFYKDLAQQVPKRDTSEVTSGKGQEQDASVGLPLLQKLQRLIHDYTESEMSSGKVPAVSDYGKSNASEAFAEAFMHYVTGLDMTSDQREAFRSVAFRQASLAERVAERWLALH